MPESLVSLRAYDSGPHRAGKKYEQIKQELSPSKPQTPAEPPAPVVPPAELAEMKLTVARLEAGLLQTGEELVAGMQAISKVEGRVEVLGAEVKQAVETVDASGQTISKVAGFFSQANLG